MELITVHSYDWTVEDQYDGDNVVVHIWCLGRDSTPYLLKIHDFPAFIYIELPILINGYFYRWNESSANRLASTISYLLKEDAPINNDFRKTKKLYYNHGQNTYPMLRLDFRNLKAMHHCERMLNNPIRTNEWGVIKCNVWEHDVPLVRKILTCQKVKFSQWFRVQGKKTDRELAISTVENEYLIDWRTMVPVPEDECQGWTTYPRLISWDIECYSHNYNAMPDKFNAADVVYIISCIYQRLGDIESRKRIGIIYGDCHDIDPSKLENCQIIRADSEINLIEEFGKVIKELDPEILIGYNILSFDNPYLEHRIKRLLRKWPDIGRIPNKLPVSKPTSWRSNAYTRNTLVYVNIDGRISIDMYRIIRRDYKMDKYDLNTVSKFFINKSKHDIDIKKTFAMYENYNNCLRDLIKHIASRLDYHIEKNSQYNITTLSKLEKRYNFDNDAEMQIYRDKYVMAKNEMTKIMEYCIQDSELVVDLMEKMKTWIGLIELSNIVGVSIVDLFTHGQQIRCYSQLYDIAATQGFIIDKRENPSYGFSGGFVHDPIPGLYENIICLDFASLYPSIIMAYNICYTTLVPPDADVPDDMCHVIDFEQDECLESDDNDKEILREKVKKTTKNEIKKKVHYRFRFVKTPEGLLPRLMKKLVTERKTVRGQMSREEEGSLIHIILDKRQNSLKVCANSFFGFLGVRDNGRMPLLEGAMSITAKGRELIEKVGNHIKNKYEGSIIYGDTDSVMVDLKISDAKECNNWGVKLSEEISGTPEQRDADGNIIKEGIPGLFPPPLKMEFEKAMRLFLLKKKKYAAFLIEKNGEFQKDSSGKNVLLKRGIVLARREHSKYLRSLYMDVLMAIINHEPIVIAIDILVNEVSNLLNDKVEYDKLLMIRELGENYKNQSHFMKIFADELLKAGKLVSSGERLEFLIVKNDKSHLLGHKMRLPEQYLEKLHSSEPEKIDYMYYIEHALMNPINQLFQVAYADIISQLSMIKYRPTNRHKFIYLDKPVKFILKMIEKGYDINMLKEVVRVNLRKLKEAPPSPRIELCIVENTSAIKISSPKLQPPILPEKETPKTEIILDII